MADDFKTCSRGPAASGSCARRRRIGKRAGGEQHPFGLDRARQLVRRDAHAAANGDVHDLARPQVVIQDALVNGWSVRAVVTGCIGVGAEMDRGTQCRECDIVAAPQITQHFAR